VGLGQAFFRAFGPFLPFDGFGRGVGQFGTEQVLEGGGWREEKKGGRREKRTGKKVNVLKYNSSTHTTTHYPHSPSHFHAVPTILFSFVLALA